ncbi:MAG: ABC transporter ATP-binding protein [Flavicella sp.]
MRNSTKDIPILKAKNLCIGYTSKNNQNCIARNLNLELLQGQMVCLIGKNGIGKSTLLKTLSKTQVPLDGNIWLGGKKLSDIRAENLAKKMGLVLTERIPESQLTVFEIIALGRQPYTNWIGKLNTKDYEAIENAMKQVNITELSTKKFNELSDGQSQKVMIARVLAQNTELIILDEPTAHLDLHHKIEVFKLLKRLVETTGKTILLSTHEVNLSLQIADSLWLMSENNFVTGSKKALIASKEMERIFPKDQIFFCENTEQFILKR